MFVVVFRGSGQLLGFVAIIARVGTAADRSRQDPHIEASALDTSEGFRCRAHETVDGKRLAIRIGLRELRDSAPPIPNTRRVGHQISGEHHFVGNAVVDFVKNRLDTGEVVLLTHKTGLPLEGSKFFRDRTQGFVGGGSIPDHRDVGSPRGRAVSTDDDLGNNENALLR